MERWRVFKFGGSSVADAVCMERVAAILEQDSHPRLAIVLSACKGVTDGLLNLITAAEEQQDDLQERIDALYRRHEQIAASLLPPAAQAAFLEQLSHDCRDPAGLLQTILQIRTA